MNDRLQALSENGVSIWLDDMSRERLRTGGLADLIKTHNLVGVTSNPTIFAKAVSEADDYADQVRDLAVRQVNLEEAVRTITTYDVRWACDVMREVYDDTDGQDGRVSIEVDPRLAHDYAATIAEARALWWLVDRANAMIKIPATLEGLPAIADATAEGISVNVTLIFSLDRYLAVMDAYLTGLERAHSAGLDLTTIRSVASFFVSRVDSEVDKRLDEVGTPEASVLKGKAAVANARLAYQAYEEVFSSDRWAALEAAGANKQRPLWASTSTKDESLPDTLYVTELIAPNTVNTMPESTLEATADHAEITGDTVTTNYADARNLLDALEDLGIPYDDVVAVLEREGVDKFVKSWEELLATVQQALEEAAAEHYRAAESAGGFGDPSDRGIR